MNETTTAPLAMRDTTANPAPLGLLAFGMTTVLLNIHNAGGYGMNSMILGMGLFYGGLAQVIAGVLEWKKNNTFGTTAFTSYGMFWLMLAATIIMPNIFKGMGMKPEEIFATNANGMGALMSVWGVFTLVMFVGTLRLSVALQVVFGSLVVLFGLLAAAFFTGNADIQHGAGYEGIFCGASAMYTGLAQVLNEVYGRVVLPLGAVKK